MISIDDDDEFYARTNIQQFNSVRTRLPAAAELIPYDFRMIGCRAVHAVRSPPPGVILYRYPVRMTIALSDFSLQGSTASRAIYHTVSLPGT